MTTTLIDKFRAIGLHEPLAPQAIIWTSADRKQYRLQDMKTEHMVYIVRLIVNEWATRVGVDPIPRKAEHGHSLKDLNFRDRPDSFFLIRARIFVVEIFRRLSAGQTLTPSGAIAWMSVIQKVNELLDRSLTTLTAGGGQ